MLNCEYCDGSGRVASGDELRGLRESVGKTAREVAEAMGVSGQYVCDLEKGRRGCSAEMLRRYEEAVGGRLGGGGEAEPAKRGKVVEGGGVVAKKKEQAVPVCEAGESVAAAASGEVNPVGKKVKWESALAQRAQTQQRTWGFKSEAEKAAEASSSKKKG